MGVAPDYEKAWKYMQMGAPGGLKTCSQDGGGGICDAEALNCFGLAYLRGLPEILDQNPARAAKYFALARDYGSSDGSYHLAMMRLGWMNTEVDEDEKEEYDEEEYEYEEEEEEDEAPGSRSTEKKDGDSRLHVHIHANLAEDGAGARKIVISADNIFKGDDLFRKLGDRISSTSDTHLNKGEYTRSLNELVRAANKGHTQALHRVGLMYSRGIGVQQNCPVAAQFLRQVAEQSPAIGQRLRKAYRSYRNGKVDLALWNYLAAAEAGVELAQSNAAWLLERGYCVGLDALGCANASVRMWKAASKQGNAEASIRVGDFHYYGRLHENEPNGATDVGFEWPFLVTYLTQPKQILRQVRSKMFVMVRHFLRKMKEIRRRVAPKQTFSSEESQKSTLASTETETQPCAAEDMDCTAPAPAEGKTPSLLQPSSREETRKSEREQSFRLAAEYYRKAVDAHSGRANFNLGFMYEWGLGLEQDFPLAKRHYDLAVMHHREAELAVSVALTAMQIHVWFVGISKQFKVSKKDSIWGWVLSLMENAVLGDRAELSELEIRRRDIFIDHLLCWDTACVVILFLTMIVLVNRHLNTRIRRFEESVNMQDTVRR